MVLGRNDKRKRKEGDLVDLMDPIAAAPKRAKVHAQRKFAQGVATGFSPLQPLLKEKERPRSTTITELITHKRPNTEDFLTFLCFRGSSILPPSLNFFNHGSKKEKLEPKSLIKRANTNQTTSLAPVSVPLSNTSECKREENDNDSANSATSTAPPSNTLPSVSTITKKKKFPTVIQKNVNINKYKAATSTVQALKKKYKEQRLAKQRIENKIKNSSVMRTRSAANRALLQPTNKLRATKVLQHIEKKSLRSRSSDTASPSDKPPAAPKQSSSKTAANAKLACKTRKKLAAEKAERDESSSSESAAEDTPSDVSKKLVKIKSLTQTKRIVRSSTSKLTKINAQNARQEASRRVTRSRSEIVPNNLQVKQRPSRKTKEAATVYMEILSRKLVSPDLDNDDNVSLDSFPEIPNTRRTVTVKPAEDESKRKIKTIKKSSTENSKSTEVYSTRSKNEKGVIQKTAIKVKKTLKSVKYSDSEDNNSVHSEHSRKEFKREIRRPVTRRHSSLLNTTTTSSVVMHNLRSSKKLSTKFEGLTKLNYQSSIIMKKKKIKVTTIKRKIEEVPKSTTETNAAKPGEKRGKKPKAKDGEESTEIRSDEEPLGTVLNRMKKNKLTKTVTSIKRTVTVRNKPSEAVKKFEPTEAVIMMKKLNEVGIDSKIIKMSDDEESFRGFSKKPVVNVTSYPASTSADVDTNPGNKKDKLKNVRTDNINSAEEVKVKDLISQLSNNATTSLNTTAISPCPSESNEKLQNIIDMSLSKSAVRKERVNMSAEQIEKWLNDNSMVKEESKAEMETVINFPYEIQTEKKLDVPNVCHLSIPTRIQHLVRPVNVTIAKMADKQFHTIALNPAASAANPEGSASGTKSVNVLPNRNKINADIKEIIKGRTVKTESNVYPATSSKMTQVASVMVDTEDKISQRFKIIDDDSNCTAVEGIPVDSDKNKKTPQRKTFLSKTKEKKTSVPNANAFSPDNECSVYAFESETETPISTPFRRKVRNIDSKLESPIGLTSFVVKASNSEKNQEKQLISTGTSTATVTSNSGKNKNIGKVVINGLTKLESLVMKRNLANEACKSPDENPSNISTGVQVNFDENQGCGKIEQILSRLIEGEKMENITQASISPEKIVGKVYPQSSAINSTEISTQTDSINDNEDDSNTQVFYIPLETVGRNISHLTNLQGQSLIQGVAVKVGTEGRSGPKQRVLLRAQLVTKPPITVTKCPPVGTVQPTARTFPSDTSDAVPSTSLSAMPVKPSAIAPAASKKKPTEELISNKLPTATKADNIGKITRTNKLPSKITARDRKLADISSKIDKTVVKEKRRQGKKPKNSLSLSSAVSSSSLASLPSSVTTERSSKKHDTLLNAKLKCPTNCPMDENYEARLVEAPTFYPTEKDFQDPLEYIEKIRLTAEKFGICKVIPPSNFKPECKISDDMRFTAYNQYVHRMLHRWGPNVKEMMAIKKYLATQSITLSQPPWIGGMEVDLPHLYQTVQSLGGLKEVIEKKKWQKVADGMKIPKSAQDRVTKLDDIYCKYLLPYDTLCTGEREKLFDDVQKEWRKRESKALKRLNDSTTSLSSLENSNNEEDEDEESSDETEECIVKGRNMPLNAFYRIARNTQRMWFGENQRNNEGNEIEGASSNEVEAAFWRHVSERKRHVCVHAASIDSSGRGFGFSVAKNSPFARHPWNLKVLTNNSSSVLRALGPLMGVTVPTIHVGMLFSACCWYRDPHGLPWIEYLHTGAKKIWYGIPNEYNDHFREALSKMVPRFCKNKTIWLPSDTAMVPPEMLVNNGVPLCKIVQEPGQFIIVFPKAFTSSICTGYVVSESVYFAQMKWLENAEQIFKDLQDSCEPSMFSFERLLFSIINDARSHIDILKQILPVMTKIREREFNYRQQLEYYGLSKKEKLPIPDSGKRRKSQKIKEDDGDYECETCRMNLFISLVNNSQDDSAYCLPHALQLLTRKKQVLKHCTLKYTFSEDELDDLIQKLQDRIEAKSKKSGQSKQSKGSVN